MIGVNYYDRAVLTCTVPYDPTPPAKTKSTYDAIAESCKVEYNASPPAQTFTTHDMVTARVTYQAPRNKIGDRQIYAGREYVYDGNEWKLLDDLKSDLANPDYEFVGECVVELIKNHDDPDSIYVQSKKAASLALDFLGRE